MAYNVLKGTVEGSVDQYGDQEIDGIKIFKNTISASVFYDTDAASPCATMKDVAITKIKGSRRGALLTYDEGTTGVAQFDLIYENDILHAKNLLVQGDISGNACGLKKVPVDQFDGKISATSLQLAPGLADIRGELQIKPYEGITTSEEGTSVSLAPHQGLSFRDRRLAIDPENSTNVRAEGQNLSDNDLLLIQDASRDMVCHTSLSNLYESYIRTKSPAPSGAPGSLQIKDGKGFGAASGLKYDMKNDILNVGGKVVSKSLKTLDNVEFEGQVTCNGAVVKNITTTTDAEYDVGPQDYTVLCDTATTNITVTLPPACNHRGRVLIFKKMTTKQYSLNSHPLKIKVEEGKLDISDSITIKMVFSTITFQSDGNKWWVIGKTGS